MSLHVLCAQPRISVDRVRQHCVREPTAVHETDVSGRTPLRLAAQRGNVLVVQMLATEFGADVNHKDMDGATTLYHAVLLRHVNLVRCLLDCHATVDPIHDRDGATPLCVAAHQSEVDIVHILVRHNADVNFESPAYGTPLYIAASYGHVAVVQLLVQEPGADVNRRMCDNGETALLVAAKHGHADVVQLLVSDPCHADVTVAAMCLMTPLFIAVHQGHYDVVKRLIMTGGADANAEIQGVNGMSSPLYHAAAKGDHRMIGVLVECKADIHAVSGMRAHQPIMIAAGMGHVDAVRVLVELRASIEYTTADGATPLFVAAQEGHAKLVKWLIKNGASVHAKWTKCHGGVITVAEIAAQQGHVIPHLKCALPGCTNAGRLKCSRCKSARYCGPTCQRAHWKAHKPCCQ